ncbi:uncharacterized protein LTR77_004958 [Saxophila tyrrhenica]|uniref:LIM zinc-binding domain-containing protein n=1 Tax=Saxophila tyrrhenica TaxID=1690608 RepID=A0AAV9PBJ3_9PEZI|nr:hypothetical protein LTR77_004958 [Saxophila tyrrhenica]
MSLGATLAAGGMRPASFLPTIKCSNCGDEIEISAMGEHLCAKSPPSPKSQKASLSNPFTLRQMNASGSKPAQPSPLQFDTPPQGRPRAPTAGSSSAPPGRLPRAPLPKINPDAANRPFLAPIPRPESPMSPALSSRSGSSMGGKPAAPLRSMTSPMPRLWDPRPPSPELSANLDCAFPPFPFGDPPGSRPGSSNGRNSPSERGSSRAGSRLDAKSPEPPMPEPRSPTRKVSDNVMNKMNTLKSGPFDPSRRRPSRDERPQQENQPLDRRRPSIPNMPFSDRPLPMPSAPKTDNFDFGKSAGMPSGQNASNSATPGTGDVSGRTAPPQRPTRPTDSLVADSLNIATINPGATMPSEFPLPPKPLQIGDRSETFPNRPEDKEEAEQQNSLSRMASEPALRGRAPARPPLPEPANSDPSQAFPSRSTSRPGVNRVDHRMEDAPPVPKPVQELHRSDSRHRPSGSDSSTASSARSVEQNTSSRGASPVTSAASSVDAFSPLSAAPGQYGEDSSMRVAGLNFKSAENPGMRAEGPNQRKSPPRNFARPVAPRSGIETPMESPVLPVGSNWPLDSPTDPGLQNGVRGNAPEQSAPPNFGQPQPPRSLKPGSGLSPADFLSDDYDPYRPVSPRTETPPPPPQQAPPHTRARSRTTNQAPSRPLSPPTAAPPRSRTPQLSRAQTFDQSRPVSPATSTSSHSRPPPLTRAQTFGPSAPSLPFQPPPIPQQPARAPLNRRPTVSGVKPTCRGCSLPIEGKSVKAADGRLTGRWHKQCFVCKTCAQPFASADFYVHANHPYCEQHYHEINGSTCAGCRRGIEGQYLETTSSGGPGGQGVERKYHPRCFTCASCRGVLSEDYFEIGGRVFCERHALAAMRAQPKQGVAPGQAGRLGVGPHGASSLSGLKAERRTTKLMMMG